MKSGNHGHERRDGRSGAFEEAVEVVELEISVACLELAPRQRFWNVCGDNGVEGSHGSKFAGEHCFALSSSGDL